jgi:hypothetical protein
VFWYLSPAGFDSVSDTTSVVPLSTKSSTAPAT